MKSFGFDGVAGSKRKVDLRGRSAGSQAESKEQLLAEARREREARAVLKARTAGATALQVRACRSPRRLERAWLTWHRRRGAAGACAPRCAPRRAPRG